MHRFFVEKENITKTKITILGDELKHMVNVLRILPGESIVICDGENTDYLCTVESIDKKSAIVKIEDVYKSKAEPPFSITLYQGVPKSDKMDFIVQKCVELGVKTIVPVETKRTVSKIKGDKKKIARWNKISKEASKQSGRGIIPKVLDVIDFKEAVKKSEETLKIFAFENEKNTSLKEVLQNNYEKSVALFIGPEGGFEEDEASFASENGFKKVVLGPRILRTETAPIAAISAIMYEMGGWEI